MYTTESTLDQLLIDKASSIPAVREVGIKLIVASLFALPFVLSSIELAKRYPVTGTIFSVLANPCIFRIGWVLYAPHFLELFRPEDEMEHIASHLQDGVEKAAPIQWWSGRKKLMVQGLILASTLPLGLTKIGLQDNKNTLALSLKMAYLVSYSIIDAGPHINHLQLQQQAIDKFSTLSGSFKAWVVMLMAGHALSDSADLWNTSGYLFYWVCAALAVEFYLSNVEAVAHYHPHFPQLSAVSMAKFSILLAGASSMAFFNWYNTFQDFSLSENDFSKMGFLVLQCVNIFFTTFEAWNHDTESQHHDDAVDFSQQYNVLHDAEAQEVSSVVKNDAAVTDETALSRTPEQSLTAPVAFFSTQEPTASDDSKTGLLPNQRNSIKSPLLFDPSIKKKRMVHAHTPTCGHKQ